MRSVSARVISAVINSATLRRVAIHKKDNKSTCSPKRSHWVLLLFLFFLLFFSLFFFATVKYRTQESRGVSNEVYDALEKFAKAESLPPLRSQSNVEKSAYVRY